MECINLYLSNDVIPYSRWKDTSEFCGMLGETLILQEGKIACFFTKRECLT